MPSKAALIAINRILNYLDIYPARRPKGLENSLASIIDEEMKNDLIEGYQLVKKWFEITKNSNIFEK